MKLFSQILGLSCLLLLTASCVREQFVEDGVGCTLIEAQIENGQTKASYDDVNGVFSWSIEDHIALYNDAGYIKARLAKIDGETAYFAVALSSTSRSHYALYPFDIMDEGHFGDDPEGLWINLPDSYYVENSETGWQEKLASYSPMPMVAVNTEGQKLYFKQLGAMVRITLQNIPSNTRVITFQTGEHISGKFRVINPASDTPSIFLSDDVASGRGNIVRVHFRQAISGELTLSIPLPPGNHSLFRVTTHTGSTQPASAWGISDKNRTFVRGDARKLTIDLSNSTPHLYSFEPANTEITIIKGLTAILPYTAMKTAANAVEAGDGLALSYYSSAPDVADADVSGDDPPVFRINAKEEGTSIFTIKGTMAGQTAYSFVKVKVVPFTGLRVDIAGLPNMLNGRDRQTLSPSVWTEPASSKELDYEWTFDWNSDNIASASVDSDGIVSAGTTDGFANIRCTVSALGSDFSDTFRVNVVTNPPGTLPGVFTYDEYGHYFFFARSNLVYWKGAAPDGWYEGYYRKDPLGSMRRGIYALAQNQYDYYTGRVYSGYIHYRPTTNLATPGFDKFHFLVPQTLFSSSSSAQTIYSLDYTSIPNPKDWYDINARKISYPIEQDLGSGWYVPSMGQWNYVLLSRRASTIETDKGTFRHCRFARIMIKDLTVMATGKTFVRGLLILPDIYEHPAGLSPLLRINERWCYDEPGTNMSEAGFNNLYAQYTAAELAQLEAAGCVFLASSGWYQGNYEDSYDGNSAESPATTPTSFQNRNTGGWYFDNVRYQDMLNTSLRVYTQEGGAMDFYYGSWPNNTNVNWDYRFSIRLVHDDGTFIHDYTRDDPVNW